MKFCVNFHCWLKFGDCLSLESIAIRWTAIAFVKDIEIRDDFGDCLMPPAEWNIQLFSEIF